MSVVKTRVVEEANRRAIERVLASDPWLVGVRPAREVVRGLAPNMILHAAPPTTWDEMCDLLRGGMIGAALFEGLATTPEEAKAKARSGELAFAAAQDYRAMAGGVGSITASLPVMVLEDRATGERSCHFLMEGFGKTLVLGMYDDEVLERLRWFRDELGPALDRALQAIGGIALRPFIAEALRRGDELHNRNAAATSMFAERLAPGFARAGVPLALQERAFALMAGNPQFFVPASLAVCRLAMNAAAGVEGSSSSRRRGGPGGRLPRRVRLRGRRASVRRLHARRVCRLGRDSASGVAGALAGPRRRRGTGPADFRIPTRSPCASTPTTASRSWATAALPPGSTSSASSKRGSAGARHRHGASTAGAGPDRLRPRLAADGVLRAGGSSVP